MANQADDDRAKNTDDWVTGDEPATGPQKSYLETLGQQTGESVDVDSLNKAEASEKIEELQGERENRETPTGDGRDIAAETDPDLSDDGEA